MAASQTAINGRGQPPGIRPLGNNGDVHAANYHCRVLVLYATTTVVVMLVLCPRRIVSHVDILEEMCRLLLHLSTPVAAHLWIASD